jgi:signal transduction histidine kinase
MKRLRLASKLSLAIVPIGLVALLAGGFVAWTFFQRTTAQEQASRAAATGVEAMTTLRNIWSEEQAVAFGTVSMGAVHGAVDTAVARLKAAGATLDPTTAAGSEMIATIAQVEPALAQARAQSASYDFVNELILSLVSEATFTFEDVGGSRDLAAASALVEAARVSFRQEQLFRFSADFDAIEDDLVTHEASFDDWIGRAIGLSSKAGAVMNNASVADIESVPSTGILVERDQEVLAVAQGIAAELAVVAGQQSERTRIEAAVIGGGTVLILLIAGWAALSIGSSMVRRVRTVTRAARRVAEVDLPNLVEALRNPQDDVETTSSVDLAVGGKDEVGELSHSFATLHRTLVEVAGQQMDVLRRGVSEIFVTLARRNGQLVDRQLALIDQLEAREEDPETLGGYYKLDHLATRMRRNAESLLVLAGTETPRVWARPLDMNDVVRAALGEVDEYQRVEVMALEPARLSGGAVTDVTHMLSELLDNATQFSPPTDRVRVTGLFDQDGYLLTISDRGLGMSDTRRTDMNRMLEKPPVLGLALDPTLGIYVVARLAARHGINVRLVPGVPGTTARVTIPRALLEVSADPLPPINTVTDGPQAHEGVRSWLDDHRPSTRNGANGNQTDEAPYQFAPPDRPASLSNDNGLAIRVPGQTVPNADQVPSQAPAPPKEPSTSAQPTPTPAHLQSDPKPVPSIDSVRGGLPVRTPGAAFTDSIAAEDSTAPSEMGAEGIRSALTAFRSGRDSAESGDDRSDVPAGKEGLR